ITSHRAGHRPNPPFRKVKRPPTTPRDPHPLPPLHCMAVGVQTAYPGQKAILTMTELQHWLEALQSSDVMTRLAAIRAVAAAQIGAAAEPLLRRLDDPSDDVRAAAVAALSRLRLSFEMAQRVRE